MKIYRFISCCSKWSFTILSIKWELFRFSGSRQQAINLFGTKYKWNTFLIFRLTWKILVESIWTESWTFPLICTKKRKRNCEWIYALVIQSIYETVRKIVIHSLHYRTFVETCTHLISDSFRSRYVMNLFTFPILFSFHFLLLVLYSIFHLIICFLSPIVCYFQKYIFLYIS